MFVLILKHSFSLCKKKKKVISQLLEPIKDVGQCKTVIVLIVFIIFFKLLKCVFSAF